MLSYHDVAENSLSFITSPKTNAWFRFDPRMQHWFRYELFWNWNQCIRGRGPTDQEESDWHNMMSGCEL